MDWIIGSLCKNAENGTCSNSSGPQTCHVDIMIPKSWGHAKNNWVKNSVIFEMDVTLYWWVSIITKLGSTSCLKCNQKKSLYFIYDVWYWERRTCVIRSPSCWFEPRSTSTCKGTCRMDSNDYGKVIVKLHQELYSLWSQLTEVSKSPSRKASSGDLGKKGSLDLSLHCFIIFHCRGAFFAWRAHILSWPRIMCSQVRMSRCMVI